MDNFRFIFELKNSLFTGKNNLLLERVYPEGTFTGIKPKIVVSHVCDRCGKEEPTRIVKNQRLCDWCIENEGILNNV